MPDIQGNNKRILKNTLVIYASMFLNMLIGLLSSRLVLQALGVSDYGLYYVVGGVVTLFAFISDSLGQTTVRFINVEKGRTDGDVNRVFNVCRVLHVGMALGLFLILEVFGIFYITHFLNVDPGKEGDAMFVFQVAAAVSCIGVTNVPYSSLFNSNEKFLFSAVVQLTGKLILLGMVFWLLYYPGNRIRVYAVMMMTTTAVQFVAFHYFSHRYWPADVAWRLVRERRYYKEMLVFSNFNLLSGASAVARGQGCNLLINYFFGTAVNGAYAVARTLQGMLMSISNNLSVAAIPQVTQCYSQGDRERVYFLISRTGRFSILLMLLMFFPLWTELESALHLWLGDVPEGALMFSKLTLLMTFVQVSDGGVWTVVNASGKLARFRTVYSLLTLLCVPTGFFLLQGGASAYALLWLFIVADVIWRFTQLLMVRRYLHFPVGRFCRDVYVPVGKVALTAMLCMLLALQVTGDSVVWHLGRVVAVLLLTAALIYALGLNVDERTRIRELLQARYYRRNTQYNQTGKVALCCIAKIENEYIRFFVEYYRQLHFDRIIIYDNNEPDGERFEEVIGDYIQSGLVQVIDFRGEAAPQLRAYQHCYDNYGQLYDWIAFFDCDEFLTFTDKDTDIHAFLDQGSFLPYQAVHVNWMVYGDNEQLDTDGRNVVERFKEPILPYDFRTPFTSFPENQHVKSIVRGGLRHIRWVSGAHTPRNYAYSCCNASGERVKLSHGYQEIDYRVAYLRHYSTKTIGEWVRTKMKRGDVYYTGEKGKQMTSVEFFFRYNHKTEEKLKYADQIANSTVS